MNTKRSTRDLTSKVKLLASFWLRLLSTTMGKEHASTIEAETFSGRAFKWQVQHDLTALKESSSMDGQAGQAWTQLSGLPFHILGRCHGETQQCEVQSLKLLAFAQAKTSGLTGFPTGTVHLQVANVKAP